MGWTLYQISPLVRVVIHVVEFFASIAVANVVVLLRTDHVIHTMQMGRMRDDRRIRPFCRWIMHQWSDTASIQIVPLWKPAEINQRRIQVNNTDRAAAAFPGIRCS